MKSKSRILNFPFLLCIILLLLGSCSKKDINITNAGPTVTDVDGNVYHSIIIGTQTWTVENLRTTRYSNGDLIGTTTTVTPDSSLGTTPKYQWVYNGNESSATTYGRLYTWFAATDSRNLAPTGWHVPNSREWMTLINFLGGPTVAGGKLKSKGESLWQWPNTHATNASGFTALPGGIWLGISFQIGVTANWWSVASSIYQEGTGDYFGVGYGWEGVSIWSYPMINGLSVRCVQD